MKIVKCAALLLLLFLAGFAGYKYFYDSDWLLAKYEERMAEYLAEVSEAYPKLEDFTGIISKAAAENPRFAEKYKGLCRLRHRAHDAGFRRKGSAPYRFYLWELFYDEPIIDADVESQPDDYKRRIFAYIGKVGPARVMEAAQFIDSDKFPSNWQNYKHYRDVPEYLNTIKAGDGEDAEQPGFEWVKWRAFSHLLRHTYSDRVAAIYASGMDISLHELNYSLEGKDILDVGTGSGVCLPVFRVCMGDKAKLAATDIDPYVLDACAFLNKDFNVKTFVCKDNSIEQPENSYDIITMLRVHLGPGIGGLYESQTVPWLQSMRKALRPGGLLIIYDDEKRIKNDIESHVTPVGFEKVLFKEEPFEDFYGNYIYIFKVKK
ncbi:class I SAM-dependent methyltransferase [bacterium]|nr:class I SAM-dependent methyltransferase [bacterium]